MEPDASNGRHIWACTPSIVLTVGESIRHLLKYMACAFLRLSWCANRVRTLSADISFVTLACTIGQYNGASVMDVTCVSVKSALSLACRTSAMACFAVPVHYW